MEVHSVHIDRMAFLISSTAEVIKVRREAILLFHAAMPAAYVVASTGAGEGATVGLVAVDATVVTVGAVDPSES